MTTLPYTGREYLDSLDDGREVWIYGERVKKIAEHPAFRNCARMLARLYDALHEDYASGRGVLSTATEWADSRIATSRRQPTPGSRSRPAMRSPALRK